jgi:hypothetical protein
LIVWTVGIGAKERNDDDWLETADSFNQILSTMNESLSTGISISESTSADNSACSGGRSRFYHRLKFIREKQNFNSNASVHIKSVLGTTEGKSLTNGSDNVECTLEDMSNQMFVSKKTVDEYFRKKVKRFHKSRIESSGEFKPKKKSKVK